MIILEALLLTNLLTSLIIAGYTDCHSGLIQNKLILCAGLVGILLDAIYYITFAGEYFGAFFLNLLVVVLISFLFYTYHLWAAGDSKLLFLVGLCVPGRFYTFWGIGTVPSFVILIFVFSIAFIYVVAESIIIGIKKKNLLQFSFGNIDYIRALLSYLSMVSVIIVINWGIWRLFSRSLNDNLVLSLAVSFFVVLSLTQLRNHLNNKKLCLLTVFGWLAVLLLILTDQYQMNTTFNFKSWVLILVLMIIRMISEKYNYQEIATSEVKVGQILSAATIISFKSSRVQGLPTGVTEDLRSRITEEEVASIKRWEESKSGKPYIVIVRKIPFAIFIGIGTIAFIILEVAMI